MDDKWVEFAQNNFVTDKEIGFFNSNRISYNSGKNFRINHIFVINSGFIFYVQKINNEVFFSDGTIYDENILFYDFEQTKNYFKNQLEKINIEFNIAGLYDYELKIQNIIAILKKLLHYDYMRNNGDDEEQQYQNCITKKYNGERYSYFSVKKFCIQLTFFCPEKYFLKWKLKNVR